MMPFFDHRYPLTRSLRWRFGILIAVLIGLIGLSLAWSWTPLRDFLDIETVVATFREFGSRTGPLIMIIAFTAAVSVSIPITFLILITILSFDPITGFLCCLAGSLLGATVSYCLGRVLGRDIVHRLGGQRVNHLSRRLAERGLITVITVRMVPIAPFAVINLIAGASHLRMRDLLLGTAIGIMPSTLTMLLFTDRIISTLKHPGQLTIMFLALTVALIALGGWSLRRLLQKQRVGSPRNRHHS